MSFKNKFQFNRIIKCTLKLFLYGMPILSCISKREKKNIHDDSNLFRRKKSFEYIARVFFKKVFVKWNEA